MKNIRLQFKVLNVFAFIAMVAVNIIAQTLPLAGHTTAEISAMYPTLLTPAPFTFSIWSVIYVLLAGVVIGQLLTSRSEATDKIGWLFAVSCALNMAWIFFWHYQRLLFATFAIAGLWVCLMMISDATEEESWLLKAAFRTYYGWITVAAAAQIYVFLSANIPAIHTRVAAVVITTMAMVLLTVFALARLFGEKDGFFGMAVAWAIAGIFINHIGPGYNGMYLSIVLTSGICTTLLLAVVVYIYARGRKPKILPEAE